MSDEEIKSRLQKLDEDENIISNTPIHAPPSWIQFCMKSRLGGLASKPKMASSSAFEAAWSKSLKNIPFFGPSFIQKWLEKNAKVPRKVQTRGYSNLCEGYVFNVEGKLGTRESYSILSQLTTHHYISFTCAMIFAEKVYSCHQFFLSILLMLSCMLGRSIQARPRFALLT